MANQQIVTRFAPSPTGFVHLGNIRTCLFNYLFAKHHQGKFLLRIEDTDVKRSTQEAVDVLFEVMNWLGLDYDGEPVYQMQNLAQHKQVAEELLARGKAYRCYTPLEELTARREEATAKGEVFRFHSSWRDKTPEDYPEGQDYVIRLKAPTEGTAMFHDLIQGDIKIPNAEIDDLVIMRSDGVPTYMLAVVVDDHNMGVNQVIRGDDHLVNTFKQILIYEAMGWEVPKFAHLPMIHAKEGGKLSKRHGAVSVTEYMHMGYLPEAFLNCLMRLGWSHGNDEIISMEQAIEWFDLAQVKKSPAKFDQDKLDHLNKYYLKSYPLDRLLERLPVELSQTFGVEKLTAIVELVRDRATTLRDLEQAIDIFRSDFRKTIIPEDLQLLQTVDNQLLLNQIHNRLAGLAVWEHDLLHQEVEDSIQQHGLKLGQVAPLLRIALTFSNRSAGGVFSILSLLGRDESLARLQEALA